MADGFVVDSEQLRRHAERLQELGDRFAAVKTAGGFIARNDEAYGFLCGWIAAILQERQVELEELISYAQDNLMLAGESLRTAAQRYEVTDDESATALSKLTREA